ncbi:MAG: TolC family protein [Crocinitomicaceae bacterium]|nr:TolC family protein [Crocinitomicaceae bacterium]
MMGRKIWIVGALCMLFGSGYSQSLDDLLKTVVENNVELKALQLEYEAQLLKVDQVTQLPNPQLGVGVPVLRPETRLGPQVMMVNASQMFPWFGTFKAKKDVVISMSKAKYESISAIRLSLFTKVKVAYYQLQFLEQKEVTLGKILKQFEGLKSISLGKVESGSGSSANVLRIQLKIDELDQVIRKLLPEKEKLYAAINSITQQPWETVITPQEPEAVAVLEFNLEEYLAKIKAHEPLMLKFDQQIQASQDRQLANKKMNSLMFGIGLNYTLVNERTDMNPEFNGRDILVPKLMLSIPLYRKSYKARNAEEVLNQEALLLRKESIETRIISQLIQFKAGYDNALLDIELNQHQMETTSSIYEMLLSNYSANGSGFDGLLQVQNQLLQYQLGIFKSEMMARIAKANIDRYTDY